MSFYCQLFVNSLITGSIYALAASGLSLSYGLLRILNFAHGAMMMLGAYFFYFLTVEQQLDLIPSAFLTVLCSLIFALVVLHIFVIPFTKANFLLSFITTLSLATMLEATVSMVFGVNVKTLSTSGEVTESLEFAGVYITPIQLLIIFSAFLLLGGIAYLIHSTPVGRQIRALSEHGPSAQSLGISHQRISYFVFSLATLLAAYAGILVGLETNMQPTMGTAYTIKAFAAMILGGFGNLWGTVLGSFLLGFVENFGIGLSFGNFSIPAGYKDAFAFLIILLVLMFKPQGLFGKKTRET